MVPIERVSRASLVETDQEVDGLGHAHVSDPAWRVRLEREPVA